MEHEDSQRSRYGLVEIILIVFVMMTMTVVTTKIIISRNEIRELVSEHDKTVFVARTTMDSLWEKLLFLEPAHLHRLEKTVFEFENLQGEEIVLKSKTKWRNSGIYDGDQLLIDHVASFGFDYLKADGSSIATAQEVRRIKIDFTVAAYANAGMIHLRTEVFPRRFMYHDFQ